MHAVVIVGTRPEAIKLAPVVRELQRRAGDARVSLCATAQHREMLDQVLQLFELRADDDLHIMQPRQTLSDLTARVCTAVTEVLARRKPDCVVVQGDTTTAMVSALAAYYQRIPVAHVEAGLRTNDRYSPFPEELNRRMIATLASMHFPPTELARAALKAENIPAADIVLTGNTVVDALRWVAAQPVSPATRELLVSYGIDEYSIPAERKLILVTGHRRESFGEPFQQLCTGLRTLVERNFNLHIVYPVHLNPNVREPVNRLLGSVDRIRLVEPLPYEAFVHVMKRAWAVLTDSGGVQEEAPCLGKPVLVLRDNTERPEGVAAGAARVVGTNATRIVAETERLLADVTAYEAMAQAVSPYGDGNASARIVDALLARYGLGARTCA